MSDVTTETQTEKKFNPEAFAMNVARALESSGQALAAYLKPRENGEPKDKPPNELAEVIKTFSTVAEYWLSDAARVSDLQM
jgi:polyhydroxyalkanoate synthase